MFAVSGLAALVYQSIWTHYLGLQLGHAAYAQTLVLAIFMGGMALGAHWASRWSPGRRRLLLAYAAVEALVGLAGLLFHPLFLGWSELSQTILLPAAGPLGLGPALQWIAGALLILPQCVLLGATFPLLAGDWLRRGHSGGEEARVLGGLYFANSFGAALGALVATFLLLPRIGLPGAVAVAGALNLLVALGALMLARRHPEPTLPSPPSAGNAPVARRLLAIAAASSACSFVYEIVWVRLLNQALGTTLHSFELMLCAFILGLALGGAAVRGLAARIGDARRWAGAMQVAMGAAALLSLPLLARSFDWVGWLMQSLARNDAGYALYLLGSALVAIVIMLPAALFAGTTLPLFTLALRREGGGEPALGRIYAANTLGAIVGVLATVHLLIPLLGLRGALLLGALGDIALGLALLAQRRNALFKATLLVAPCLALAVLFGRIDPLAQASAVYRTGEASLSGARVLSMEDGKTATISVVQRGEGLSILSNGKPDASITSLRSPPTGDEATMLMLAALPLALHPAPREVAMIGWGSGLSTHALLASQRVERLTSIEIEAAMARQARAFGERVQRAYLDPRSILHIDDARTVFAGSPLRYDVIISEPSNPWVSGVASLFTVEFYRLLRGRLAEGGLLVQWMQTYELDDALLASMLAALLEVFSEVEAYAAGDGDLILLAPTGPLPAVLPAAWGEPALVAQLSRVGLDTPRNLLFHRIGDARLLRAFVAWQAQPAHSDFLPRVALEAPRARFAGRSSELLQSLIGHGLPVLDLLGCRPPQALPAWRWDGLGSAQRQRHWLAAELAAGLRGGAASPALLRELPAYAASLESLLALSRRLDRASLPLWTYELAVVAGAALGPLPPSTLQGALIGPDWLDPDDADLRPAEAALALSMLDAAARRDPPALRRWAGELLEADPNLISPLLRSQAMELEVLAAAALGQRSDAARREPELAARSPLIGWLSRLPAEGTGCARAAYTRP
nr:fused MFS/spermidine synthase [Lysobacter sp. CAU 1642]